MAGVSNNYSTPDLCSPTLGDNLSSNEGEAWNGFLGREALNGYWWKENEIENERRWEPVPVVRVRQSGRWLLYFWLNSNSTFLGCLIGEYEGGGRENGCG